MVTSFAIVVNRAQNIAADHVQIMEIDLNAVKVSGDETKLYNTNAPAPIADVPEPAPEPAPAPAKSDSEPVDEVPLDTPSLIEEKEPVPVQETPKEEPKKQDEKPAAVPTDTPNAPKKKTVVRVNREVVSLDRTLTISVVDALRVAMTRCWTIDTTRPDIADMRAVAHLTMRQNGTVRDVWFESAARAESDPAFAYVLETIRSAINVCQPFKMLPANEFSKWEKIQLTFYPTSGRVM
ncbi:MAG: hypothetical protein NC311_02270 [Muribaculaceae bacterium]|nr:hypothetical protein [Muribaculaceae bacterium]